MATRHLCPENDAAFAKVVGKMNGQASIGELVERSGLGGYGFDAVVRALFAGQLRLVEYCISTSTRCSRGRQKATPKFSLTQTGGPPEAPPPAPSPPSCLSLACLAAATVRGMDTVTVFQTISCSTA